MTFLGVNWEGLLKTESTWRGRQLVFKEVSLQFFL